MNDRTWKVLCKSWADRNWSGIERNVGKCDSVPVCGRAGEPSGTTILVCDFGVPSLMIVSTRFRLRFFTGGEKHEAPLFQLPTKAQCRARFFDRRAIRRILPIGSFSFLRPFLSKSITLSKTRLYFNLCVGWNRWIFFFEILIYDRSVSRLRISMRSEILDREEKFVDVITIDYLAKIARSCDWRRLQIFRENLARDRSYWATIAGGNPR